MVCGEFWFLVGGACALSVRLICSVESGLHDVSHSRASVARVEDALQGGDELRIHIHSAHDFGVDFEDVIIIRHFVGIVVAPVFGANDGMAFMVASLSERRVEGVVNQWF